MTKLSIRRGADHETRADICTVVMSYKAQATTADAVQSLLRQDTECEIVVVNSGGPSLEPILAPFLDRILLVESPIRLLPGGARNIGIRHSTAPVVSFLAADCLAGDKWLARRIAAHNAGYTAVASALRPAATEGVVPPVARASYWITHTQRMPEVPADKAHLYGASYVREAFSRFGMFREDLLVSEDSQFHAKLRDADAFPAWDPLIVTFHRYPATLREALVDQFVRARRHVAYLKNEMGHGRPGILFRLTKRIVVIQRFLRAWLNASDDRDDMAARRLVPLLLGAHLLGACIGVMRPTQ